MNRRPRRNRKSQAIRDMVQETSLGKQNLLFPLFLLEGNHKVEPVKSMPGISRFSLDFLLKEIDECVNLGLSSFAVFPCLSEDKKDKYATESANKEGLYIKALEKIKQEFPHIALMTDVAMDPYSSDGHDGLVEKR